MMFDKPEGNCENCGERPADLWWVGEGGTLGFVHGMRAAWCKRCCVRAQIAHAEAAAARLPELRRELEALTGAGG